MGVEKTKKQVVDLLRSGAWDRLEAAARADPRLLGVLIWALFHPDEELAWRAVEGFGRAISALVETDEELCKDRMRRLYWALNDESGTSGRFVAPAIGEVVARSPAVFGENALIPMNALDEPFLQAGAAWAFGRIGGVRPDLVLEIAPRLCFLLQSPDPQVRGHAAWALGEMRAEEAADELNALAGDTAKISIFTNGSLREITVGELAVAAGEKLKNG
ncbi:MAG: DVU0298 family protein [Bacillota bacterium]